MSILIKGMEMPEKQVYVILNPNGLVEVLDANNVLLEEYQFVSVPEHGRLIDADALLEDTTNLHVDVLADWVYVKISTIEGAPTIIPADKEGEG